MCFKLQQLALLLLFLVATESKCTTTFITTCESISDVITYGNSTWKNLIISNDLCSHEKSPEPVQNTLEYETFKECPDLEELYIIRQIKDIQVGALRLDHLTYLKLYKNDIKVIPKSVFLNVSQLFKLDLTDNCIENIQHGVFRMPNIYWIILSNNKLKNIETDQVDIPSLKKLTVTFNDITTLIPECFHKNLEYLDLDHNNLQYVEGGVFEHLQSLKVLIISNNKLDGISVSFGLASLEKLDLSHNVIAGISEFSFTKFPELQYLNIGHNQLKYLSPQIFAEKTKIKVLKLNNNLLINLDGRIESRLTSLQEISIGANPWICTCLAVLNQVIRQKNIRQPDCENDYYSNGQFPICSFPDKSSNDCTGVETISDGIYVGFRQFVENYNC